MIPSDTPSDDQNPADDQRHSVKNQPNENFNDAWPVFDFEEFAGDSAIVIIRFNGVPYRLRRTRNNRLVLHK